MKSEISHIHEFSLFENKSFPYIRTKRQEPTLFNLPIALNPSNLNFLKIIFLAR